MTFPSTGSLYHPGAVFELPGFDPDWSTVTKHEHEITPAGEVTLLKELELPVSQGESLPFAAMLFIFDSGTAGALGLRVGVPQGTLGGFMVQALNLSGNYETYSYGADDFNTLLADSYLPGIEGTLESWHPVRVEGMIVAGGPGLLRLSVLGLLGHVTVKAGSFLKGYRQHDSRPV